MKKLVAFFFLAVYGCTAFGNSVNMHYCMGKYVGASLFHSHDNECPKCGMKAEKKKGCCKDEKKTVQLQREHGKQNSNVEITKIQLDYVAITTPIFYLNNNTFTCHKVKSSDFQNLPPPLIPKLRLHVLHCVFLI